MSQEISTEVIITSALDLFVLLKCGDYLIACRPALEFSIDRASRKISSCQVIVETPLYPDESSYLICKANGQT